MKVFLQIFLIIILLNNIVFAQNWNGKQGGRSGDGARPEITITGFVIDENAQNPLEFATVAFFSKKDSSILGGAIANEIGKFEAKVKMGKMFAKVDFIGYDTKVINPVEIDFKQIKEGIKTFDIGNIALSQNGIALNEIEIVGEKSETTFSLDKKVFTVGKDLGNRGGTAQEILDNVPSVTVDVEGEVSLRGSTGVRVLIDGRPSNYSSENTDALKQIPANLIETVEVITNPSSRYEAEGQAGIINITLKKQKRSGFNGSFDVVAGIPTKMGISANVNYRKNKINWFANLGIEDRSSFGGGTKYQEITNAINGSLAIQDQKSKRERNNSGYNARFGFDYFLKETEILTGAFKYRNGAANNENTTEIDYYSNSFEDGNLNTNETRTEFEREDDSESQLSLNYKKKFATPKKEMNLSVSYQSDLEEESSYFDEQRTEFTGNTSTTKKIPQQAFIDEGSKEWIFTFDFVQPLKGKDHQLEYGFRFSDRNIGNDFEVNDSISNAWIINPDFTNEFTYDENISAAYFQYGNRFKKFDKLSYQIGLRAENAKVVTQLKTEELPGGNKYFRIFPSAFFNYEISETNKIQLSYSNRIKRPRFFELNPFITFADRRNRFEGNGSLIPEITDSYELNYLLFYDKATISAGVFYRNSANPIERLLANYPEDSISIRKPLNLKSRNDVGIDVNIGYSGLKWYRLDANISAFNFRTNAENIAATDEAVLYGLEENAIIQNFSWTTRITNRFTFWKGSQLQLRANYRAARETIQGKRDGVFSLDFGWSKDFLKQKNLTATISVRDVFNSRRRSGTIETANVYTESEFQWRARTSDLTISYRINQRKKFKRPSFGGSEGF